MKAIVWTMILDIVIMGLVERVGICAVEMFFFLLGLGIYLNNKNRVA